jgi:hypothetical protein
MPLIVNTGNAQRDSEVREARRVLRFLRGDADGQACRRYAARAKVLRCVISRTTPQRGEQQFWRRRASVRPNILERLIGSYLSFRATT